MKEMIRSIVFFLSGQSLAWASFTVLVFIGILYRVRLYYGLLHTDVRPFAFDPEIYPFFFTLQYLSYEILFALVFTSIILIIRQSLRLLRNKILAQLAYFFLLIFCLIAIILVALVYAAHYRLIIEMQSGLEFSLLQEAVQAFTLSDFFNMLATTDILFLILSLGCFYLFYFYPRHLKPVTKSVLLLFTIGVLLLPVGFSGSDKPLIARELRLNPVYFALQDVFSSAAQVIPETEKEITDRIHQQLQSIAFTDPLFVRDEDISNQKSCSASGLWNIVFIILESTGAEYVFNTSLGNEVPMPFFRKLTAQGLFLANHYSVGNSSPRAVFSLFSGTYESPTPDFFSLRHDLKIPALNSFFPEHREQFLVTPCSVFWYFPKHYLEANGLREIYGYHNLPVNSESPAPPDVRNEIETAYFFISRMEMAQEPFFATYITFAPHYPYFDFGEAYRILPNLQNRLHRYYNALRLQDVILEKIYRSLEKKGRLERTILIVVGDHSEAFWQHPDNRVHSLYSYNENLRTPAMIWQPKLFKPIVLMEPTSHIDIVPTLLSAICRNYNPKLFQGENLMNTERRRRYIFSYGNENTLSIINRHNLKMQLLFKDNICRLFNLVVDPLEKNPLPCTGYEKMQQAGIAFVNFQPEVMKEYNRQYTLSRSFNGESHPILR